MASPLALMEQQCPYQDRAEDHFPALSNERKTFGKLLDRMSWSKFCVKLLLRSRTAAALLEGIVLEQDRTIYCSQHHLTRPESSQIVSGKSQRHCTLSPVKDQFKPGHIRSLLSFIAYKFHH